ncbi:lytic transglycosylase domain-containing protein [Dorea formicigenerans]|uniref:lytic transglycosylase domain-containing protein n=1 Tax=Dorea formicigenerans TaxID=39486 RepID=UPI00207A3044|nr:lytic transglycosylase domain-containing protein [Dorea formicigenerans]
MKVKRKRRMSRRRRERTYIAVMVLLAITVSIGLTRSVMRDDKEFEEYEQQSQEFNARMQRIDEKREASGQNAMLEQVRTWQQEQDTEPDKYAVFDTMSADWGGEEDGFVLYEIPEEYSRTGGYFPEKMQVYTYCVCKQYGVRYDLVVALIEKESGYKFDKVGDDGHSIGYMQIYEEYHRDRMERLNVTEVSCNR